MGHLDQMRRDDLGDIVMVKVGDIIASGRRKREGCVVTQGEPRHKKTCDDKWSEQCRKKPTTPNGLILNMVIPCDVGLGW